MYQPNNPGTRQVFLLCLLLAVISAQSVEAQLNHAANYGDIADFLCGEGGREPGASCADRDPPLTPNAIADIVGELERLEAISAYEDQIEEDDLIENGFFRLCEAEPVRCLGWIADLGRTGSLDGDVDGVLDGADLCPGTTTPIARAQSLLLAEDRALREVTELMFQVRASLIQSINGTLGDAERFTIGEQLKPLFFDLYVLSNKKEKGRYLFGGDEDRKRPFRRSGSFDDQDGPIVTYVGSNTPLSLKIGPADDLRPVLFPGSQTLLADMNLDGQFPDTPGQSLFDFIKRARIAIQSKDRDAMYLALTALDEAIAFQIGSARHGINQAYVATQRIFPTRERSRVDAKGCSQIQFCSLAVIEKQKDAKACAASDFLNDEPLRRSPGDCRVKKRKGTSQCVPAYSRDS